MKIEQRAMQMDAIPASAPGPTLDDLLETWSVLEAGVWENDTGPPDWWAVANDDGIVAYFASERDAYRWRFDMINRAMNP